MLSFFTTLMRINLISSSEKKIKYFKSLGLDIKEHRVEIKEIQGTHLEILEAKAREAQKITKLDNILVDDTAIEFGELSPFPGVYAKDFIISLGYPKIHDILDKIGRRCKMTTILGLIHKDVFYTFTGTVTGDVLDQPRDHKWIDEVFVTDNQIKTISNMNSKEKLIYTNRGIASMKLVEFLNRIC